MTDVLLPLDTPISVPPHMPAYVERMRAVQEQAHFLPVSVVELNTAANLLGSSNFTGVRHTIEVHRHQQKARDKRREQADLFDDSPFIDPMEATTRVLWSIAGYAVNARSSSTELTSLYQDVRQATRLDRTIEEQRRDIAAGYSDEMPHGLTRGLPEFLRFKLLADYVRSAKVGEEFPLPPVVDSDGYTVGDLVTVAPNHPDVQANLAALASKTSLSQIRQGIGLAIGSQQARERFWRKTLVDTSQRHPVPKAQQAARRMLISLDIAKA